MSTKNHDLKLSEPKLYTYRLTNGKQRGSLSIVINPEICFRLGLSLDDSLTQQLVDGGCILLKAVPREILGVE